MTTTVIKQVKASGGDYVDLATAWAAIPSNLITVDQQWILEFTGSFSTNATLTGKTCDATRNIILRPATGHGFSDVPSNAIFPASANGAILSATAAADIVSIGQPCLTAQGLQFLSTAGAGNAAIIISSPSDLTTVLLDCVVASSNGSSGNNGTIVGAVAYTSVNTIIINTAGGNAVMDSGNAAHHNSAAYGTGGTGFGFRGNYSAPIRLNCAAFGFATAFRSDSGTGSDYCASDDTSAPGTHALHSLTFANQVINTTSDFHAKAGAATLLAGTPDSSVTSNLDALKQTRSGSTPSIGPLEFFVPPLTVSGTAPGGTVGSAYTTTFTASGGTSPYTYSVGSGTIPAGTTLNTSTGVLSGTPSAATTYPFVIHAHDNAGTPLTGDSAAQSVVIVASGPPPPPPAPPPASPTVANIVLEAAAAGAAVTVQVFAVTNGRASSELCSYGFSDSGSGRTGTLTVPAAVGGSCTLAVPLTAGAIAATTIGQSVLVSVLNGIESTGNGTVLHTGAIA